MMSFHYVVMSGWRGPRAGSGPFGTRPARGLVGNRPRGARRWRQFADLRQRTKPSLEQPELGGFTGDDAAGGVGDIAGAQSEVVEQFVQGSRQAEHIP